MSQTFGQLLAAADARFARNGGYKAAACCETRRCDLVCQDADGTETIVLSGSMPRGRAPEDIAHDLLAAHIGEAAAADLDFVVTPR